MVVVVGGGSGDDDNTDGFIEWMTADGSCTKRRHRLSSLACLLARSLRRAKNSGGIVATYVQVQGLVLLLQSFLFSFFLSYPTREIAVFFLKHISFNPFAEAEAKPAQ